MQAKDIMTSNPISLIVNMELGQAVQTMLDNDISIAAVTTYDGNIIGQVSEVSVLRAFILSKSTPEKKLLNDYRQVFKSVDKVYEDDTIDQVVKVLLKSHYNRVHVVTRGDRIRGIISPKDIIRGLMGEEHRSGSMLHELNEMGKKIEELKTTIDNREDKIKTYEKFIHGSDYMMHSVDKNGKIIVANNKLSQALGYRPGDLIGKSVYLLYELRHHDEIKKSLEKLIEEKKFIKTYSTYVTKTGETLRVEVASSVLKDSKGGFVATSTISRIIDQDDLLRALHGVYESENALPGAEKPKKAKK